MKIMFGRFAEFLPPTDALRQPAKDITAAAEDWWAKAHPTILRNSRRSISYFPFCYVVLVQLPVPGLRWCRVIFRLSILGGKGTYNGLKFSACGEDLRVCAVDEVIRFPRVGEQVE